jgi:hypothetical protein
VNEKTQKSGGMKREKLQRNRRPENNDATGTKKVDKEKIRDRRTRNVNVNKIF